MTYRTDDPPTKPTDLDSESICRLLLSRPTIFIYVV